LSTCVSGSSLFTGSAETGSLLAGLAVDELPDVVLAGWVLGLDVWLGEDELDPPLKRLSINTVCPLGSNQARPLTASP